MGYSPEEQAYTYASFNGSGGSRTLRAWVQGEKWVFTGGRERLGKFARWQVTITPNTKGFTIHSSPTASRFRLIQALG